MTTPTPVPWSVVRWRDKTGDEWWGCPESVYDGHARPFVVTLVEIERTYGPLTPIGVNDLQALLAELDEVKAEVKLLRPVVEAAQAWYANGAFPERYRAELSAAVETYEAVANRYEGVPCDRLATRASSR